MNFSYYVLKLQKMIYIKKVGKCLKHSLSNQQMERQIYMA